MKTALKRIQNKIIGWGKKPTFWLPLTAGIIVFMGIYFYRNLVVNSIDWFFENPEGARNLIYLFAALFGGYLLYRRTRAAEEEVSISKQNIEIAKQNRKDSEQNKKDIEKKITSDQRDLAVQQINSDNPSTRLNGIFNLERVAKEHEEEGERIMQILSTRIRELAPRDIEKEKQTVLGIQKISLWAQPQNRREDIEVIIKALSRIRGLYLDKKYITCNLQGTDLSGLLLFGVNLSNFDLSNANLNSTRLLGSNLAGVYIFSSNLVGASLSSVSLVGASLISCNLTGLSLFSTNLDGARFIGSNFTDASLNKSNISNADFENAKYLTSEQIKEAFCWEGEPPRNLPDGLELPPMRKKPKDWSSTDMPLPPPPLSSS